MKKHIPNFITLINVFSGAVAIACTLEGHLKYIPYLVAVSLLADFLDGMIARALNVKSELGKQLDSLADVISFGVLPSMILYMLMKESLYGSYAISNFLGFEVLAFLVAVFAALRLGKFNIDTRQSDSFIGLPTPAATLFVLGVLLINQYSEYSFLVKLTKNYTALSVTSILISLLMIAELPLLSLKMGSLSISKYKWQWALVGGSLLFIIIFGINSLPMVIGYYLLLSIAQTASK